MFGESTGHFICRGKDYNWSDSDPPSHMREVVELKEDRRLRTAGTIKWVKGDGHDCRIICRPWLTRVIPLGLTGFLTCDVVIRYDYMISLE